MACYLIKAGPLYMLINQTIQLNCLMITLITLPVLCCKLTEPFKLNVEVMAT